MNDPRLEVLAAIGELALRDMQGQPERIRALFDALMPRYLDVYPHHKILAGLCQEAREPKDVTPGKTAVVDCNGDWFGATLADGRVIERDELEQLAAALVGVGYAPEDVRTVNCEQDEERSLTDGQRVALLAAMREATA